MVHHGYRALRNILAHRDLAKPFYAFVCQVHPQDTLSFGTLQSILVGQIRWERITHSGWRWEMRKIRICGKCLVSDGHQIEKRVKEAHDEWKSRTQ